MLKLKLNKNRRGFVLVAVLAIIVLLMGVLMDFTYRARVQLDMASNRLNAARARQAAESGVDIVRRMLSAPIPLTATELEVFFEDGKRMHFGDYEVLIRLEPESRKFNLNRLVSGGEPRMSEVRTLRALADLITDHNRDPVLTEDMIYSIVEWMAAEGRVSGVPGESAGSEFYNQKSPPYECKHAELDTISELLLVKGITEEVLYGSQGTDSEQGVPGMASFFSLYGSNNRIRGEVRGDVSFEDLDPDPLPDERFLTVDVTARIGNAERRIRTVVDLEGQRVQELHREEWRGN